MTCLSKLTWLKIEESALPREALLKGRINTVNLLALTNIDLLLLIMNILFTFSQKEATRRSTVLSLPLQLVFPDPTIIFGLLRKITFSEISRLIYFSCCNNGKIKNFQVSTHNIDCFCYSIN